MKLFLVLKASEDIFTKWPPWWSRDKVTMETSTWYVSINDVSILSKFGGIPVNSTEDIVKILFWLCADPEPGLNYAENETVQPPL